MTPYNEIQNVAIWVGNDDRIHLTLTWRRPEDVNLSNEWVFATTQQAIAVDKLLHATVNDALRHTPRLKQQP